MDLVIVLYRAMFLVNKTLPQHCQVCFLISHCYICRRRLHCRHPLYQNHYGFEGVDPIRMITNTMKTMRRLTTKLIRTTKRYQRQHQYQLLHRTHLQRVHLYFKVQGNVPEISTIKKMKRPTTKPMTAMRRHRRRHQL